MSNAVLQPMVKALPIGANNIYTAGLMHQNQAINKQSALIQSAHGGWRRRRSRRRTHSRRKKTQRRKLPKKRRKGGATSLSVPTFPNLYPEVGAGNQTINGNSLAGAQVSVNATNNSKFDACVGQPASCTALRGT